MKAPTLKQLIKSKGLSIGFLEKEAKLPGNTFYNFVNGSYPLPGKHRAAIKKVLKKYKINYAM